MRAKRPKATYVVMLGALALIGYISLQLRAQYRSQVELQGSVLRQLRLETERAALSVGYFFSQCRSDVLDLAAGRELSAFLTNRDLGMSMQYGLGASLAAMRQRFERLLTGPRVRSDPAFEGVAFVDHLGQVLVEVGICGTREMLDGQAHLALDSRNPQIVVQTHGAGSRVVVSAPCFYKSELAGLVIAWFRPETLNRHLVDASGGASGRWISLTDRQAGLFLTPLPEFIPEGSLHSDELPLDSGGHYHIVHGKDQGSGSELVAMVSEIQETPFALAAFVSATQVFGRVSPQRLLLTSAAVALLILCGVAVILRFNTHNLVLRARFDETARRQEELEAKNQQLEGEVRRRQAAEECLLAAKEAAEAANRAKSQFLANMSHEIRTPMNGVVGALELLTRGNPTDHQRQLIGRAHRSALLLVRLLSDILDLSKIEAGKLTLEAVDFDLRRLLEEATDLFAGEARAKGIELRWSVAEEASTSFRGDSVRLRQVLTNLLGNAIKFTEEGEVELRAAPLAESGAQTTLRFEVRDTGIGIAPEAATRIFDAFSQADSSTTRRFGGSGLGLTISRHLVSLMGGELGVESEPGKGSRFWFVISLDRPSSEEAGSSLPGPRPEPVSEPVEAISRSPAKTPGAENHSQLRPRVLLAEDNPVNQEVAREMLEILGYRVDLAINGREAVEATSLSEYDLILMDCQMPEMDGYEATRAIREGERSRPHRRRTPIVAVTGHAMAGDREACLASGMDDYVTKPFGIHQLEAAAKRWMAGAAMGGDRFTASQGN